jgi:hypothetical protein
MNPSAGSWAPNCPVCGRPTGDVGPGPCPACGLPAVAQAALVVARIHTTLTELARDRDALVATLRAAAPGAPPTTPAPTPAPAPWMPPAAATPPHHPAAAPVARRAPTSVGFSPAPPHRRRLSPQQVLLGLGALLVVAAAVTFVAVAWTRFGLVFQAGVMLTATALACGVSAWTARRGLRATEEALAAAGAALLVVDLGAARALGLFRLEEIPLRPWWAISSGSVALLAVLLGRLTRTTAVWPLTALLAAQPLPFLLLPPDLLAGPAGVAVALVVAGADLVAARFLRPYLGRVALVLAGITGGAGVIGGLISAVEGPVGDAWAATAILAGAGAAAVALTRLPRPSGLLPSPVSVAAVAAGVVGLAVAGALDLTGDAGPAVATYLGLALLTLAVLAAQFDVACAALTTGGAALAVLGASFLSEAPDLRPLEFALLAAAVPAALAAVRLTALRRPATGAALAAPGLAILTARADGDLTAPVAGLLLALLAAVAFGLAALRAGRAEEWVCAAAGAAAGLAAGLTSADVAAWGQVGIQLGIAGAAAGCYAVAAGHRWVGVTAVADLVLASWIAVGGADVQTPEGYTLPAAVGLLLRPSS